MRFKQYSDVKVFYKDTYDILMRHEALNLIPLGNIIIGNEGKDKMGWRDPVNWFMATVTDDSGLRLTAVMTPPHNLTLYATDNVIDDAALACLIDGMQGVACAGVMSEKSLAERFAQMYSAANNAECKIECNLRIYELVRVNPEIPAVGTLRLARESDMSFLPYWAEGFMYDCFGDPLIVKNVAEDYRYHISNNRLYILEDNGTPVSMAKASREMQNVCGVGLVYTPPYFRGKGYASSCVAGASRKILGRGFTKCVLYTDLANPTSNSIYQKIGYNPICDSIEIKFEAKK
ncbi:MAG: GNAT family N-acetyltransferase [Defluviitaleaceae bacterium]|nr:GNAT family N-acetyltransferase [Defluviitaleaceae bacterium]MCL2837324.1 GNAT family N-acetyltransferase [Defluviitaleaceae bacterium]